MLQIASGKLFSRPVGRRNEHRGVLYTNLRMVRDAPIDTAFGRLLPVTTHYNSSALTFETTELMEEPSTPPMVLMSRGMDPYLDEFALIASFSLNVVCTPNPSLATRLLNDQRSTAARERPQKLVRRFFDDEVWCQQKDEAHLQELVRDLLALERRSYRAAVRAIRSYVTGLHRLADDRELAYTLLVASLESLAQGFDGVKGTWEDFDSEKRRRLDGALADADKSTVDRVRSALLEVEHVSLARRFRDFTLDHVTPAYFREETRLEDGPIGRTELPEALRGAYRIRSKHIHNLDELPRLLTLPFGDNFPETITPDRTPLLTFQGLARLSRFVITEFIRRQPKAESEIYDYSLEQAGVIQVRMAPRYWVGHTDGHLRGSGRSKFEGFAEEICAHLVREPNATVTDLRDMLAKVEPMLPSLCAVDRRPFVATHILFNQYAPAEMKMSTCSEIRLKFEADLTGPSVDSMFFHLLASIEPSWPLHEHRRVHGEYFQRRHWKGGLRMPKALEAGASLVLAERYRAAKEVATAAGLISHAVENFPGNERLRRLEAAFQADAEIDWHQVLIKVPSENEAR